jgi:putative transposase
MARLGRIVAAGFPHYVTQRGDRRQTIFFEPADDALCRGLLATRSRKARCEKRATGKVSP